MQIGAYTPHALQTPATGSGLEHDVARTRDALGVTAAHRAVSVAADTPDAAAAAGDGDAGITRSLAYTATGRIREGSVRPRISIVV